MSGRRRYGDNLWWACETSTGKLKSYIFIFIHQMLETSINLYTAALARNVIYK